MNNLSKKYTQKQVVIVVPLSKRNVFTPDEKISLRHLVYFLGKYDKYFIVPKDLQIDYPGFAIKRFNKKFFGSVKAHRNLMFSPYFYEAFIGYQYILIYHLDSLVFSDQLIPWCNMDFDFIGAPWVKHKDAPYSMTSRYVGKVGNGGFSLRKIKSFLKVIYSPRYAISPSKYWDKISASKQKHLKYLYLPAKLLKHLKVFNNARWEMHRYPRLGEDFFWTSRATHYCPEFKIAPIETALRFAFECVPRYCFSQNKYSLPFGCHAWQKYDRAFWEPYLLK